jgi:uncharacterized protein (TIGR02246 family)
MKSTATILLALVAMACSQPKLDLKAEGEKVMQMSKEWSEAASSGDLEKTVSYWADHAIMMSAGEAPIEGKPAIRQMVEESFNIPGFRISWQPQRVEVSESGDMAYLIEDAQVSFQDSTGNTITQHNKTVSIWKKQRDGSWKNVVDISTPTPSH